jgi:hypothetical protein
LWFEGWGDVAAMGLNWIEMDWIGVRKSASFRNFIYLVDRSLHPFRDTKCCAR